MEPQPLTHRRFLAVAGPGSARAATRAKRIVQGGLQDRSCPGLRGAAAWLQEGHLGKPLWAHIVWFEHPPPNGNCAPFVPTDLDYDVWCGPAPVEPLTRPRLHYDWHWFWSTGDGDVGNSSVHAFVACRIFLPGEVFPKRILSLGGRFTYDDAAQTPNTRLTVAGYPALPIVIENRNLSMDKDAVVMDRFRGVQEGFVLQYEGGYFAGFRMGGAVFGNDGNLIRRFQGDNGESHQANFLKVLRSRKASDLNAPIVEGHVSSAVCHWGNISYRLGRPGHVPAGQSALGNGPPVAEGFTRLVKSLEGIGVDLDKTPFALGLWLELDPTTGDILKAGDGDVGQLEQARRLARGTHRAPYVCPA